MDYFTKIPEFDNITLKRQMYLRHLVADPARNMSEACKKSGYVGKKISSQAARIMKCPKVQYILKRYDQLVAADNADLKEKIIKELCMIAFSNIKEFISWSDKHFDFKDSKDLEDEFSRVIQELSFNPTQFGDNKKIKLHDKIKAIQELNKMHGFYATEKLDLTNSDGNMKADIVLVEIPKNGREKK